MIEQRHRAVVRAETAISIAINALIPTAVIWAIGLAPPTQLLGLGQLVHGMSLASGLATCLMTLAVTLIVRGRVRRRVDLALPRGDVPPIVRWLPALLPLRALTMGVVAVIVLVPSGVAVVTALGLLPLTSGGFIAFNLIYGVFVGLTMTPAVVLRALADTVATRE